MDRASKPASNSPLLMADPGDPEFVLATHRLDAPAFGCALQLSGDGGRGWVPAQPLKALPPGVETCYAPEAVFDRAGRIYYLFVGLAGRGNRPVGAFLTYSDDRARTFSPPRQVLGPNSFAVRMALDRDAGQRGRLHLAWIAAGSDPPFGGFAANGNPIMTAYSDDGGATFSEPKQVNGPSRSRVVAPALIAGDDREVHVAYYDLGTDVRDYQGLAGPRWNGVWSLVVRSSADGGRTFGAERVVDSAIVPPERSMLIFTMPAPAIVRGRNGLCLSWADARNGDPDVLLRCEAGPTERWDPVRRLNDDPVANGRSQYLPSLGVAPSGRIDAVFFDRRADPHNRLHEVAYTFSIDGGGFFVGNMKLTAEPSNTQIGPRYGVPSAEGQVEWGGRLGLLSTPSEALAAWPDARNGERASTSQDLFATTVRFGTGQPASSSGDRKGFLAVAGIASLALAAAGAARRPGRRG